jgi:hypothetical protein
MEDTADGTCGSSSNLSKATTQTIIRKGWFSFLDTLEKCLPVNLHAYFYMASLFRGSLVELWVFERSRPYSFEKFDLHKSPDRFIKVLAGYTMMSNEELDLKHIHQRG